jgi:hypothetical protein
MGNVIVNDRFSLVSWDSRVCVLGVTSSLVMQLQMVLVGIFTCHVSD